MPRGNPQLRAQAELALRERRGRNFTQFVNDVRPDYEWHPHNRQLVDILERTEQGEITRLMIFMPPRHGKSEEVSRLFSAYYLYKNPGKHVGICSYSAEIALGLSRSSRDNYSRAGGTVDHRERATGNWRTLEGGGAWAAGVGGSITGRGFDLGIIDDPLKNAAEAYSSAIREKQKEWWRSTFFTRREPGAAIILIQTRWHHDDLAGWLLDRERESPQRWHIVSFEAVKTDSPVVVPETCTLEPDPRAPGEPLCPARFDLDALETSRRQSGSAVWSALYQQRPTAEEGGIWMRGWFKPFDLFNLANLRVKIFDTGYDWDLAYTNDDRNSASAYVKAARDAEGNIYVLDFDFRWLEFPQLIRWMAAQGGPHYVEQKASGKSAVQTLKEHHIAAYEVAVAGVDWLSRAKLASPIAENGRVFVAAHLIDRLLNDPRQGLALFPNASHTDLNDAFVQSLNRLFKRTDAMRSMTDVRFAPGILSGLSGY